jgi:hypothetical protein
MLAASSLCAGTLTVVAPKDSAITTATATTADKAEVSGKPEGNKATFQDVPANIPVNVQLTLADKSILQGVDLSWYNDEPLPPDVQPLNDDDREQIRAIVQDVPSFYNKSDILLLTGDHSRAVGLVQLLRDTDFHAAGGNIVWRVELYYFKFQYGGWEKVQQQNKIVRRERYKSVDAYKTATEKLNWVAELGGIEVGATETKEVSVNLKPDVKE